MPGVGIIITPSAEFTLSTQPTLPIELVELILTHLWTFPTHTHTHPSSSSLSKTSTNDDAFTLPTSARISLMLTLPLVSKSFLSLYIRVSSRDVYIPCPSYAEWWFRAVVIGFGWPGFPAPGLVPPPEDTFNIADTLCHSITFILDSSVMSPSLDSSHSPNSLINSTLDLIRCTQTLFGLRKIAIEIIDLAYDDVLQEGRLVDCVPEQIRSLEIAYLFSTDSDRNTGNTIEGVDKDVRNWSLGGNPDPAVISIEELDELRANDEPDDDDDESDSNKGSTSELPIMNVSGASTRTRAYVPYPSHTLPGIKTLRFTGFIGLETITEYMNICTEVEEVYVDSDLLRPVVISIGTGGDNYTRKRTRESSSNGKMVMYPWSGPSPRTSTI